MTQLRYSDLRVFDECPRCFAQRRAAAPRKGGWLVRAWVGLGIAALLLAYVLTTLRVTSLYEDGSGELSDGRAFCIEGELCEREEAP